ncbi:Cloroperoxidase [Dothidotthia symphoricarpi CBS 119687]|uniref:Cloroperoxidase n=1 Tax=Dothidotthia symphoricarpi CBS 119687 TaxID=1392245 RepID=A0A6A6ART2_9PLEO|nr:Cloroperoxidase [Dothidotthia symphoricarpi CBS 119687]KAF2133888.1 Cloroperoxidase [Dothidotthia symphoricarpi CBS 119687]
MVFFKTTALLTALPFVAAYPWAMELNEQLQKREEPPSRDPVFLSGRPNTGNPSVGFDVRAQFVNVTRGSGREFVAPTSGDLRGQCPGLNAAANHGFIPHSGILSTAQTVKGLGDAYNMSPDLATVLAVIATALSGDPIGGTWSIGGAYSPTVPIFPAGGIVSTHNKYENDASIVRGDAYLNGGNVGVFQMRSWEHLYQLAEEYTLDDIAKQSDYVTRWSVLNNPYYFSGPFSGLVAPAAHDFVINFMSNHSAEKPGGTLTRETLKSFFAVTGDAPGSFVHNRGQERIPDNWYKRPAANAYNLVNVLQDLLVNNAMYPGSIRIGGNTGTVNSFAGVDLGDLTGGAFNLATLGQGNNGACFLLQASLAGLPSATLPLLGTVGSILNWATQQLGPISSSLGCPQLATFDDTLFNQFPGAS